MPYSKGSINSSSVEYQRIDDSSPAKPLCNPTDDQCGEFKMLMRQDLSDRSLSDTGSPTLEECGSPAQRLLVLCACTLVGFVMNVMVSVVAPFFPTEAKKLTGASNGVIGLIFAVFPLCNLAVCPVVNYAIRKIGRKATLMSGLVVLAASTVGFGLSTSVPLWIVTRILQGAGSAACGAAYYAILSDMYQESLGLVIGVQEAVTGLGFMGGPFVGSLLYTLGGFRLPFLVLGACPFFILLILPPLLRDARNFEHEYDPNPQLPSCDNSPSYYSPFSSPHFSPTKLVSVLSPPEHQAAKEPDSAWRRVRQLPFMYVALGTTLATCGFAFVEPVLSEHLMTSLNVSTSLAGVLMGIPSITYIIAAPLGGWLGEKIGYRPILFMGFVVFGLGLWLVGPSPIFPFDLGGKLVWPVQMIALSMLGIGSAFGTITTLPDMKHVAGPGTTDLTASIFNNVCVPSGEVLGPLVGGLLTQMVGLPLAAFYLGCLLLAYALVLLGMHVTGHMSWRHHREEDDVMPMLESRRNARLSMTEQGLLDGGKRGEGAWYGSSLESGSGSRYVSFRDDTSVPRPAVERIQ